MKMSHRIGVVLLGTSLAGCATYPPGPSVMALPGPGVDFAHFQADDTDCQGYAQHASGARSAQQAGTDSAINSAAVGTAVGAAIGALLGAASHSAGAGAAVGAGAGFLLGSAGGVDENRGSAQAAQQRYDNAYVQCMYAKGHQVPVADSAAIQYNVVAPPRAPAANPAGVASVPPPDTPAPSMVPPLANQPPPNMPAPPGY